MSKKLSRAPQVNVQKCVENTGSQFDLVLIASHRVREMRRAQRNKAETPKGVIDALLEIQEGKVDAQEYLDKVGKRKTQRD